MYGARYFVSALNIHVQNASITLNSLREKKEKDEKSKGRKLDI